MPRKFAALLIAIIVAALAVATIARADYSGSANVTSPNTFILPVATEILGDGGGSGSFIYKGGGNAVDAAVATALAACVVNPANASLGGYGGHMMIYKSGLDGGTQMVTCIDFNSAAGSLSSSNMFVGSVNLTNGHWTGASPAANQIGWKAVAVPGTFAGLFMAQTNYGRKMDGTNYFPFSEILKPALARLANGQAAGNSYYTLSSVSNLLMELYTNSNPYGAFYTGDIAQDIVAAMQAYGGLVTLADMTNYRPREVTPFARHFNCPNGTPATVYVAPPGSAGLSVLQEIAMIDAIGWTNGPTGTWDSLRYWHSRAEVARLMWKDHFQWIGDPWGGVLPPDFLGNGSTNYCDQMLAHATNGYTHGCAWDTNEVRITNSLANSVTDSVNNQTNVTISVDWDDIRYGTRNISTSDKWGNCVAVTFSMGGGYGAQVGVTNRGLVFGQGIALFDARPGWPDSIGPGKRPVDNMCPAIVIPDFPTSPTNGTAGGRPPFAVGGVGGSTIENNMAMHLVKYLMDAPSSSVSDPTVSLYNFEANKIIYMRPSYPAGVQSYLGTVGYSAPGNPPSAGEVSHVEAWIPPTIISQLTNMNVASGSTVVLTVNATGLPLFYQWFKNGVALTNGATISGAQTPQLTINSISNSASFVVVITNGAASVSATAALSVDGAPAISVQPASRTNFAGTPATFSVTAIGNATLTYQWLKGGTNISDNGNISGATTSLLNLNSVSNADAGTYSVLVSNAVGTATSLGATLTVTTSAPTYLSLLWSVSTSDGKAWMTTSTSTSIPNQRTIAYNALSNHLYVVSRSSGTTSNYVVHVLNATNGTLLYTLKTNGIQSNVGKGGIGLVGIAVGDDGAIYACCEAPDASGSGGADPSSLFRVYRWANADSNTSPSLIFSGDPSAISTGLRWGDNLFVRGSGTNTQILLDMTFFSGGTTNYGSVAIISPTNALMTNFSARWFATTNFATGVGRSLEFDSTNNSIWQKEAGNVLFKTTFDPATSLGGTKISSANVLAATNFPSALMGVGLDLTRNLAAGVFSNSTTTADSLNLYDISNLNSPVPLSQYSFPTTPRVANANRITQTFFKNDLLFTLDANNGIMVFRIVDAPPVITSQPASLTNEAGTLATFTVSASGNLLAYQWTKNGGTVPGATSSMLNLANISATDAATYAVVITNLGGSVTSAPATLTVTNPPSQPFLYEPFDYVNIGSPVSSNTPANWTYGGSGANDSSLVSGNLSYPGLADSIGNSVTNGGAGLGVRRLFGTNLSSGKIYFSALFRINDLGFGAWSGAGSIIGALAATDNTSFRLQVVVKSNSPTGYVIGTQKSGTGATTTYDTTERHAGDTVFVVGKYDFTVASNAVTLWINPSSANFGATNEPVTGFITATNGTDGFTIDRFNMRQNASTGGSSVPASIQWDELRFGFSWADVTPAAPSYSVMGTVKLTGFKQLSGGTFQFTYTNSDSLAYNVFASTNLVDWQSIGAATQTSPGLFQFTDSSASNITRRFYQLRTK